MDKLKTKTKVKKVVKAKAKTPKKNGRPTLYKQEYDMQVFNLCLLGAIDTQICKAFGIDDNTFYAWQKRHPSFRDAIKTAKNFIDANVAATLYKRAQGYTYEEVKTIETKDGVFTSTTTKHVPADTAAMIFWLKNRQPKLWRDKIELKEDINVNIFPSENVLNGIYEEVLSESFAAQNLITNRLKNLNDVIDEAELTELKEE